MVEREEYWKLEHQSTYPEEPSHLNHGKQEAGELETNIHKILWATDLSENSAKALPLVSLLAEKHQAEVHVVYVLEEMGRFGAWYGDFERSELDRLQEIERNEAEERLEAICEDHLKGCPLYVRHTAVGDPAAEILEAIYREKVDMVVLATKGRGGTFPFGGVSEKIVKHSPVPVLVVPTNTER
jgi:nucleotide-binding universal stress UspA family protein